MAVYFVQDSRTHEIKIGYTGDSDPSVRVSVLQTGNPAALVVLHVLEWGDRSTESRLHRQFAAYRSAGEWFRPGPDLIAFIVHCVRDDTEFDTLRHNWEIP